MLLKKTKQNGFILITVLLIVVLMTAILLKFNYASRTSLLATDKNYRQLQAINCARAGLNIALAALRQNPDITANDSLRRMIAEPAIFEIGPGQCSITVSAENGKININKLKDGNDHLDRIRIDQLLRLIDLLNHHEKNYHNPTPISYGLVPAVIDWTDPDDQVTVLTFVSRDNTGAESSYYRKASPLRQCKNRPLASIDELLLIKGITPQILHGRHVTLNEQNPTGPLSNHITIYGDGKIDINTASSLVIQSLSQYIGPALAQMIIDHRNRRPFSEIDELKKFPGITPAIYATLSNTVTTQSLDQYFTITVSGTVNQVCSVITAIIRLNSSSQNVELLLYRES
ncbi:MAG: general secretion pathway protein GspK [Sedimentisphaerales bacterium]|nr:general secretion pathway protein GspK [Sedimentisphaerales bacterium]